MYDETNFRATQANKERRSNYRRFGKNILFSVDELSLLVSIEPGGRPVRVGRVIETNRRRPFWTNFSPNENATGL